MQLRQLELCDAPFMIEWMTDPEINKFFRFNIDNITLESTIDYITKSKTDDKNKHYAIVDDNNEYLGTISLKEINNIDLTAEYAISLRKMAQGMGVSKFATDSILKIAFDELNLNKVYLNVLSDNIRAVRFYEKTGFVFEGEFRKHIRVHGELKNLKWFSILKEEYIYTHPLRRGIKL